MRRPDTPRSYALKSRLQDLGNRLTGIIDPARIEGFRDLVQAGEMKVALEDVCADLIDTEVSLSREVHRKLVKLCTELKLDESRWRGIRSTQHPAENELPAPILEMVAILGRAFPRGVSDSQYPALLAAIFDEVSEENLGLAVSTFTGIDPVVVVNDAARAVTTQRPTLGEVKDVRRRLTEAGLDA